MAPLKMGSWGGRFPDTEKLDARVLCSDQSAHTVENPATMLPSAAVKRVCANSRQKPTAAIPIGRTP